MMKENINFNTFHDRFKNSDNYKNNFSYEGLKSLFEYLEDYEENTNIEIEFDMIAICCEFTEYDNLKEYNTEYEEVESLEDIEELATVIEIPDTNRFIIGIY